MYLTLHLATGVEFQKNWDSQEDMDFQKGVNVIHNEIV